MGKIVLEQNRLIFQRRDELVVIEAYGRNCLRTRATRNACISDENWTLLPPATEDNCIIEGNEDFATITNGDVKATIEADFHGMAALSVLYRKDKLILKTINEQSKILHKERHPL